jgi:serine/threonine protein phosphatase 1
MTGATIARLSEGGRIWALGAQQGDHRALAILAGELLQRWRRGDKLVVLGNMLGASGDPARVLDLLLRLRRRLLATNLACDVFFLRGSQEEMWHKVLSLQFAMSPLDVLDWMLERGLGAIIEAYRGSVEEGRSACRTGRPVAIARWTIGLRELQMSRAGHADLLNSLMRAAISADGGLLLSAAGVDATRPMEDQADAFWWNGQSDAVLDAALGRGAEASWRGVTRLVRGTGTVTGEADDDRRVLTVTRGRPALVAIDAAGALLDRIEA